MRLAGIEGLHGRRKGKKRSRLGAGAVALDLVKRRGTRPTRWLAPCRARLRGDVHRVRQLEGGVGVAPVQVALLVADVGNNVVPQ
jgi:hypothetical protein